MFTMPRDRLSTTNQKKKRTFSQLSKKEQLNINKLSEFLKLFNEIKNKGMVKINPEKYNLFLKLKNEIIDFYSKELDENINFLKSEIHSFENKIEEKKREFSKKEEDISKLKSEISNLQNTITKITNSIDFIEINYEEKENCKNNQINNEIMINDRSQEIINLKNRFAYIQQLPEEVTTYYKNRMLVLENFTTLKQELKSLKNYRNKWKDKVYTSEIIKLKEELTKNKQEYKNTCLELNSSKSKKVKEPKKWFIKFVKNFTLGLYDLRKRYEKLVLKYDKKSQLLGLKADKYLEKSKKINDNILFLEGIKKEYENEIMKVQTKLSKTDNSLNIETSENINIKIQKRLKDIEEEKTRITQSIIQHENFIDNLNKKNIELKSTIDKVETDVVDGCIKSVTNELYKHKQSYENLRTDSHEELKTFKVLAEGLLKSKEKNLNDQESKVEKVKKDNFFDSSFKELATLNNKLLPLTSFREELSQVKIDKFTDKDESIFTYIRDSKLEILEYSGVDMSMSLEQ